MLRVDAIDVALSNTRAPQTSRQTALPNNMSDLIRIAAAHQETVDRYAHEKKQKPEQLIEAAQFFLQSLILESGDDAFKTLGLRPGATVSDIKDHKRMLLKWLHPDLNKNRWQSSLFNRVQTAAERLQNSIEIDVEAVQPPTSKKQMTTRRQRKRKPIPISYQRKSGRLAIVMRSIGIPVLTIAASAAMIYLVNTQFNAGTFMHNRLQQLLP